MTIHDLKTDTVPFDDVFKGRKTFEIRFDDRKFEVGDILHLKETSYSGRQMATGKPLNYTGREVLAKVLHKLSGYGVKRGWCVLSIKVLDVVGGF